MVYSGKPSRSCAECRLRRTKCDMARPSCSQCLRASRLCKGYRNVSELMFRDESHNVKERARCRKAFQVEPPKSQADGSAASGLLARSTKAPIPAKLNPSPDSQASSFFFHNYVPDKESFPTGSFNYLADLFKTEKIEQEVADGVASLGMAGLSNFWKSPAIMVDANMKYTSALKGLGSKLRNVRDAKNDQTLIAVMLLGLFETNTCHSKHSMEAWTKHTSGATALLRLRGKGKLRKGLSYHTFIHHRAQIIANCMQRGVPMPGIIREWNDALSFEDAASHAITMLSNLYIDFANLRGYINQNAGAEYANPVDIILKASTIDVACVEWAKSCPLAYIYRTVRARKVTNEVFSDRYHVYPKLWIAAVWNNYRCLRIMINELILDQLSHLPEEQVLNSGGADYENLASTAHEAVVQCANDICSSVPYILGYDLDQQESLRIPRAFNGNLLLWPLYNAGNTDQISDYQRRWIIERLRYIAEVVGVRQATPLFHSLKAKIGIDEWDGDGIDRAENKTLLANWFRHGHFAVPVRK